MRKYLIQILVILTMAGVAWGLYWLSPTGGKAENKPDVVYPRLPNNIASNFIPVRDWSIKEPDILAQSAIVVNFKSGNEEEVILYKKNIDQILPIASLTKLMTAIIALENFNQEEIIKVSKNSILTIGDKGGLISGEELKVKDLLYIMLMESSNDAAIALATDNPRLDYDEFIKLMNSKVQEMGLKNIKFFDPTGLSFENRSTSLELAKLAFYALNFPLLWEILKTPEATIYSIDNKFIHNLTNTNKLLNKISFLMGGKTGYTDEAGGCMLTVSDIPNGKFINSDNYLITVVLGSEQREDDTEKLINWAEEAFTW